MYPSAKTKEPMDIFESKLLTINFNVDKFGKKKYPSCHQALMINKTELKKVFKKQSYKQTKRTTMK